MSGVLLRACRAASSVATAPRFRPSNVIRFFNDETKENDRWVIGDNMKTKIDDETDILKFADDEKSNEKIFEPEHVIIAGIGEEMEKIVVPAIENDFEPIESEVEGDLTSADLDDNDDERDTLQDKIYQDWDLQDGDIVLPEMMNWMLPRSQRTPLRAPKEKLWTEFVKADLDPVELALNTDLLRLFLSPNGRMLPRRFTGLRAKQQRQLATAIKVSRQMALLPYTSRYPLPSPEQMEQLTQQAMAQYDDFDFDGVDDNDKEDEYDAMYVED